MKKNNTRYYFDLDSKKCLEFEYGGCRGIKLLHFMPGQNEYFLILGNDNNFLTIMQCERICGFMNNNTENLGTYFYN